MEQPELMTEQQLADYAQVHVETVRRWRRLKIGPPVVWAGPRRPRYRRTDVDQWMERGGPDQAERRG